MGARRGDRRAAGCAGEEQPAAARQLCAGDGLVDAGRDGAAHARGLSDQHLRLGGVVGEGALTPYFAQAFELGAELADSAAIMEIEADVLSPNALGAILTERSIDQSGGMPDRVKCLHVLAAHALAAGPGVNPLGDEVVPGEMP